MIGLHLIQMSQEMTDSNFKYPSFYFQCMHWGHLEFQVNKITIFTSVSVTNTSLVTVADCWEGVGTTLWGFPA